MAAGQAGLTAATSPGPGARFAAVQLEFGFPLGPANGRYLMRPDAEADPDRVLVLATLGAPERRRLRGRRGRELTDAQPEPVPTARATLVGAEPFASDSEAAGWLDGLKGDDDRLEEAVSDAVRRLNAALRVHRAAAGDPYAREVSVEQALVVRVGYGSGDAVADGRFRAAWELPAGRRRAGRRTMEAPDERFAALVGGRGSTMACEELVLRARADLDAERPREAALQARVALEALLAELGEALPDERRAELEADRDPVARAASAALRRDPVAEPVAAAVGRMEAALKRRRLGA